MNQKNDNLSFNDSSTQLDKNISRLVKLENESNKPSTAFSQSLIDNALCKLEQAEIQRKDKEKNVILKISWWKKAMGWAAMFAAACGTGLTFVVSAFLTVNAFFTATVIITMFANWLTFLGGLVL
jgi:hypothetical protein